MGEQNGFDLTAIIRWRDAFQQVLDDGEIDKFVRQSLHYIANRALDKIIKRTPVNIGTLRRNWKLGPITETSDGYMIEVYNNTEYASFVENGFRSHWVPGHWEGNIFVYEPGAKEGMQVGKRNGWVTGRFMMKISMNEIEKGLPKYLERRQREFLQILMKKAGF